MLFPLLQEIWRALWNQFTHSFLIFTLYLANPHCGKSPFFVQKVENKIWTFGMVCPHSTSHTPSTLILLIKKSFTFTRVVLVLYWWIFPLLFLSPSKDIPFILVEIIKSKTIVCRCSFHSLSVSAIDETLMVVDKAYKTVSYVCHTALIFFKQKICQSGSFNFTKNMRDVRSVSGMIRVTGISGIQ